ncbi:MAG TPA: heterodisulfide reductase-related iron-sulfur binding cluster, partial [Candidatus Binataceae bacterium]|nr:heterodisulfide reductase-related iron-sulfur binding cluster [Candidatus Binataceae bacterium]
MNEQVTRQILWNIPAAFIVIMYGLLVLLLAAFAYVGWQWYRMISLGSAENRFDQLPRRVFLALRDAFGQGYVVRETWGWMHYAFYVGFVGLFIGTTIVLINSDLRELLALVGVPLYFYYGDFYLVFKAAMDTFFLVLIAGVLMEGMRRTLRQPSVLNQPPADKTIDNFENRAGYALPMTLMVLVALTGLMLEGARINAAHPRFTEWAYIGNILASIEGSLGAGATYHRWLWIVHVLLVYGLLFCFPFTKLRHLFFGPLNLFFRNLKPRGRLAPIKDFETAETFGVSQVEQYHWKQLLDMSACLECGRCTINCPTVNTGKTLNPKFLVIEQREHLLQKAPFLLAFRANGTNGSEAPAWDGPDMITQVATEAAVWACTSCGWCEEGCPVGIEHIQRIVDMRRYQVLMESKFPQEVTGAFKGIENQGNPWGLAAEKRAEWAKDLEIREMAEVEDPADLDVLYWVGCAGSFDERNQKVSRAFASLMKQAGVKFAILGREETCTGDPARRLGNEYLYATMAQQNVETLNRYKPRRIVTQCPHCFHNLKNEYPDFGGNYKVLHEAEFLAELVRAGRLKPKQALKARVTYHDPCYMARHNRRWDGARETLRSIPGTDVAEVDQSKNRTFCCGAGGGCMWKEEHEGTRINQKRFDQLNEAKPECVAVGCPFCMTMLEDAVKSRSLEESMRVRDLAELMAEA